MKKTTTIILAVLFTANMMAQVPNYVPTNGLVGWWPFNGNANDESGNGNNGTVNGATLTTDRFGNANKAYSFDGNLNKIQTNINQLTNFSVSLWFNASSSITWYPSLIIFGERTTNFDEILHLLGNHPSYISQNRQNRLNIGFAGLESNISTNINEWQNIVITYNNLDTVKLYINGVLNTKKKCNKSLKNTNKAYFGNSSDGIAMDGAGASGLLGKLDDIGIWNRVLTQEEITVLYTVCANNLTITPTNNDKIIGSNATFTASVSDPNPSYIWQSDLGQGFQTLNNVGKYSGTSTKNMSISNVQLSNHMQPIRAISVSGNCRDTSNIAYVKITDTCITKITKYDTIKVMDTLVINATLSGISAPNNTNRIIVYPNPAKDHITIDYGVFSKMSGYTMKITNTLGQTVFSSPINQQSSFINLSSWTGKGVYYLQIIDKQNSIIENRKIILQ